MSKEYEEKDEIITTEQAEEQLDKYGKEAIEILEDEDKAERFLQRLERKLKKVPLVGEKLSYIPVLASLVKSYINKEYQDIPIGSIISIVAALAYFVSPIDLIPDAIPVIGLLDDAAVVGLCWKMVEDDVEEYLKWRVENGKNLLD